MSKIKVPAHIFDFCYLISLEYPDMELPVELNVLMDIEDYCGFILDIKKTEGMNVGIYNWCKHHKLTTKNLLEKEWELL